jgi:hypothetical protein
VHPRLTSPEKGVSTRFTAEVAVGGERSFSPAGVFAHTPRGTEGRNRQTQRGFFESFRRHRPSHGVSRLYAARSAGVVARDAIRVYDRPTARPSVLRAGKQSTKLGRHRMKTTLSARFGSKSGRRHEGCGFKWINFWLELCVGEVQWRSAAHLLGVVARGARGACRWIPSTFQSRATSRL